MELDLLTQGTSYGYFEMGDTIEISFSLFYVIILLNFAATYLHWCFGFGLQLGNGSLILIYWYVLCAQLWISPDSAASKGTSNRLVLIHDDVIKWTHFPRYWPFVQGIHRSPVNSHHKGQLCRALMFSLICAWMNGWVNNREAGKLRCHRAHYDVTVIYCWALKLCTLKIPSDTGMTRLIGILYYAV